MIFIALFLTKSLSLPIPIPTPAPQFLAAMMSIGTSPFGGLGLPGMGTGYGGFGLGGIGTAYGLGAVGMGNPFLGVGL
jgi:hypothetical protein